MAKEKTQRRVRAYKIADTAYQSAMTRASKESPELATRVEEWVTAFGAGKRIIIQETTTAEKVKESGLDEDRFMAYLLKTTGNDKAISKKIHDYIFKAIK